MFIFKPIFYFPKHLNKKVLGISTLSVLTTYNIEYLNVQNLRIHCPPRSKVLRDGIIFFKAVKDHLSCKTLVCQLKSEECMKSFFFSNLKNALKTFVIWDQFLNVQISCVACNGRNSADFGAL